MDWYLAGALVCLVGGLGVAGAIVWAVVKPAPPRPLREARRIIAAHGRKSDSDKFRLITELGGLADLWPDDRMYHDDGRKRR